MTAVTPPKYSTARVWLAMKSALRWVSVASAYV
jgi:hypothetical protein